MINVARKRRAVIMKVDQHIPNFCTGITPKYAELTTLAELLEIPFIHNWTKETNFLQFSWSEYGHNNWLLMAEMNEGEKWWVVARINGNVPDGLPMWDTVEAFKKDKLKKQCN